MHRIVIISSAVILGVVVMLLPVLFIMPLYQYTQVKTATGETFSANFSVAIGNNETRLLLANATKGGGIMTDLSDDVRAAQVLGRLDAGAVPFPSSLVDAGMIVILGLVIALGASLYIQRRM